MESVERRNGDIMAKNKNNKNDGKVTAGDLFDKLKSKNSTPKVSSARDDELFSPENDSSIDVSSNEESDSELDINELLRKYMPEYGEDAKEDEKSDSSSGVLSKLKKSADTIENDEGDDRLISALDSAFGPPDEESVSAGEFDFVDGNESAGDHSPEEAGEDDDFDADLDYADENFVPLRKSKEKGKEKGNKKKFSLFGRKSGKKEKAEEQEDIVSREPVPPSETDLEAFLSPEPDEKNEPGPAVTETDEKISAVSQEKAGFDTADIQLGDIAELESILQEPHHENKITPVMRKAESNENPVKEDDSEPAGLNFSLDAFSDTKENVPAEAAEPKEKTDAAETDDTAFAADTEETPEEEIDPTDLNLRVAFGLDSKQEASAAAKQFGDRLEAKQYKREKRAKLDRPEFVDKTQIPKIRKEYQSRLVSLWIKLGFCLIFTVVLMWFENISFFTGLFTGAPKQFAGVFDPAVYPVVYIMASLQLMLFACVCAYEQIIDGFKYLFRGTPRAESMTSLLFVAGVLYSAILARVISPPNEPVMFNFAVAISALLTLVYSIYNTRRERMNFEVVSSMKTKHIVRRLPDEESQCEAEAFMEQTDVCDVMKIEKTDFIDGFFGRLYKPDSTITVFMTCMMGIVAAMAVLFGFFVNIRGAEADTVLRIAYLTMLIVAPLSVYITFSYPFYRATIAAKEYDSAIIGEASLAEYSNASIISFDDKNVFPSYSVKIQNIKIYNNARVDRVLYYAASVFAYAGGPLQDVFEVATLEMGHSSDVKIFDTEAGFLATQVNGVNIIFGSYKALTAKGFDIPPENAADDVDFSSELSIMYMFREDKLVAKMYIKYVMDGDIDLILKQFQGTGLYVCVRTFDPNIDERMIAKKLNMKKIPLKVVRYASTEEVSMYEEKVDSGLVTCSSPKSLLQVIAYCDKVLHTRKTNIALSVLSVIIGMAILVLLVLSDTVGVVNSLFVALYHLIWTIPMVVSAKMFIR